ncbi:hypothetical protein GCM10010377_02270 [Streptomyces viridiviolaceus]|nr:hypothetical protein GCM10010377_02270 [Streptomyces viridiviolaceus]
MFPLYGGTAAGVLTVAGIGMVPIALVPYTRLVHMFSAPVQHLVRPYVVYRSRVPRRPGPRPDRRGWERAGS